MPRNKHKIPGFTLSEMLVVLVVTAIVVGLAFSVLRLVSQQVNAMKTSYEAQVEMSKFKQQIRLDMDGGYTCYWNSSNSILTMQKSSDTLWYDFSELKPLRNNDTIHLTVFKTDFYFLGKKVNAGNIDAIELQIGSEKKAMTLFARAQDAAIIHLQ